MVQKTHQNELVVYRRRWGLSQKRVATLLGHQDTSMVSRYENGKSLPPLDTALRLEIIYRVPVAFLYYKLYASLRDHIRATEATSAGLRQIPLF
jgi:transcriptional regulator with XRE-family HTH domain